MATYLLEVERFVGEDASLSNQEEVDSPTEPSKAIIAGNLAAHLAVSLQEIEQTGLIRYETVWDWVSLSLSCGRGPSA
jgi:hypothetical protein